MVNYDYQILDRRSIAMFFDAIFDIFGAIFMSILQALGLLNFGW